WHRHDSIVCEHVLEKRIERRIVDVGNQHALSQIVQNDDATASTQAAKGSLMQLRPRARTGTENQQSDRLAAVAERHHEQPGSPVLAALRIAYHRAGAVIDLAFFSGRRHDDSNGFWSLR